MAKLATKADVLAVRNDLLPMEQRLQKELHDNFELVILRLTLRFGVIMVVWVATAAIILKPARHSPSWINCLF